MKIGARRTLKKLISLFFHFFCAVDLLKTKSDVPFDKIKLLLRNQRRLRKIVSCLAGVLQLRIFGVII